MFFELKTYKFFQEGILALSRMEQQGLRIDMKYAEEKKLELTKEIEKLEVEFKETKLYKHWAHTTKNKVNIYSPQQLGAFLYGTKKIKISKETASGQGATDEEALQELGIPELDILLRIKKLKKVRDTYLDAFVREQVNGIVHPFFNLHLVRTFRGCIAKGTKILAVRDFKEFSNGVPIEKIKAGDYVYCFDNNLNPAIRKVLWAGKTGYKKVIRVYWSSKGGGGKGYLDLTPEHKIRLIDGSYVEAQNLIGDFRKEFENKMLPKIRTLSCKRVDDFLSFTGHLKSGKGILEHRLIYKELIGPLKDNEVIHHINGDHLDHKITNLKKMSLRRHSYIHSKNVSEEVKQIRINTLNKNRNKIEYKIGYENHNDLKLSKYSCYKLLAQVAGQLVKVNHDFDTFKKHLERNNIDPQVIKLRYDKNGNYIWKSKLKQLSKLGRSIVSKKLGHNYYRLIKLYEFYGINIERKWSNQFGEFKVGNHIITKIEYINKYVDVYDLQVEEYNNFFANEICVHNSSDSPNFQNIPKRDKETMEICRRAILPRPGHQFVELDYKQLEVRISCCYNRDEQLKEDILAGDMHKEMAIRIFHIEDFNKETTGHSVLRSATKNGFIFPQFYGDYYKNCAVNLSYGWGHLPKNRKWKSTDGIEFEDGKLGAHLISNGIKDLESFTQHIKVIEDYFWNVRYKDYTKWKERWWEQYQRVGHITSMTGFNYQGVMKKNDVLNYPIQGSAFHCLLWSIIQGIKVQVKEKWKSRLVSQIHDAIVMDVHPDELEHVVKTMKRIMCEDIVKHWGWITVPLDVDVEIHNVNDSWADKPQR